MDRGGQSCHRGRPSSTSCVINPSSSSMFRSHGFSNWPQNEECAADGRAMYQSIQWNKRPLTLRSYRIRKSVDRRRPHILYITVNMRCYAFGRNTRSQHTGCKVSSFRETVLVVFPSLPIFSMHKPSRWVSLGDAQNSPRKATCETPFPCSLELRNWTAGVSKSTGS